MENIVSGSGGLSPLPISYYENFLEVLARLVSKLLTDKETETILTSMRSFHERLKRLSSHNLHQLNLEITATDQTRPHLCRHEGKTCIQNSTRGFLKTFTVAFVVKYLIGLLPALLSGKILKKPSILKRMAGRDTVSFALFLSTFISGYKGILCTMRHFRNTDDRRSDRLNAFVAGSLAGLALALDRNKQRRQSIMLYLFTRALQFSGAWLMKEWALKRSQNHPGEEKWDDHLAKAIQKSSGVLVSMISSAQLIYAFLLNRDTMQNSYFSFLLSHSNFRNNYGDMASSAVQAISTTFHQFSEDNLPITIPDGMSSREFIAQTVSPNLASSIPSKLYHKFVICAIQHPQTDSCIGDKFTLFQDQFLRSLKLYVPLNVFMLAIFKSKHLLLNPSVTLQKFAFSCLRSTIFLSMYVVMGLSTTCTTRKLLNIEKPWMYALIGAVSGSMVSIEVPGRQLELGLYMLTRAIESFWNTLLKNKVVKSVPHGEILVFMGSMGTLMTLYQNDKDTINSHYMSVMTRFFGKN